MASLLPYKEQQQWILKWGWTIDGNQDTHRKTRRWRNAAERRRAPATLQQQLLEVEVVEHHVKARIIPPGGVNEIETWIEKKYIKPETAAKVWTGFQATTDLRGKTPHIDWKKIKEAYTDHYLKPLKEGSKRRDSNRKAFRNHMSQFKIVSDWLKTNHPGLTPSDVELRKWQESMLAKGYTASTVNKRRSALSVILKVAVEADMILRNPLDKSEPAPIKTLKEIQKRPRQPMSGAEVANTVKRITEKLDLYSNPNAVPNMRKYPMNGIR